MEPREGDDGGRGEFVLFENEVRKCRVIHGVKRCLKRFGRIKAKNIYLTLNGKLRLTL